MPPVSEATLLAAIVADLDPTPRPPARALAGPLMAAVSGRRTGLASRTDRDPDPRPIDNADADALARRLPETTPSTLERAFALAAANACLTPAAVTSGVKAQELILKHGHGKRVTVVGHFPFVGAMREVFETFEVLELNPRPGDLPASAAADILPATDLAAITASSIVNGSLAGLLNLLPKTCTTILLGPSTPLTPRLFDLGIHTLAGCRVTDPEACLAGVRQGIHFRRLPGVEFVVMERE
jgi:uncharacterized protein (DUF4213/DUF364 family)